MKVVTLGGGMVGLSASMLLARDGHDVTLLERDSSAPAEPDDAWTAWDRRGVNQFRLPNFLLSRFRATVEAELPLLAEALADSGACRYNVVDNIPDSAKGGTRPDDARFNLITGRRPVVEAVTARVAEETPRLTIRRGSAVRGLAVGAPARQGVPNITAAELDTGERIAGDLVLDVTGRRSPLADWVVAAGGALAHREVEDSGFVYYARHFRSEDGALPVMAGPLVQDYAGFSALTFAS
jgi:2-polyprenyl-6-methoxyphenol hydroxylase-like FAD-dependent oxidoreductase